MIIRITEIKPGTMKFFDSSELLYQTRSCASTGDTRCSPPRRFSASVRSSSE